MTVSLGGKTKDDVLEVVDVDVDVEVIVVTDVPFTRATLDLADKRCSRSSGRN